MPDRPLSRRDTLKRAASALALGCIAPAALAAPTPSGPAPLAPEAPTFRLSVFAPDGTLIQTLRLSDAAGRKLRDSGGLGSIAFQAVDGEAVYTHATFDLRTG